jgi:hypothetical protein
MRKKPFNIGKKLDYYTQWYREMSLKEKRSIIGLWVKQNIERYCEAVRDEVRQAA